MLSILASYFLCLNIERKVMISSLFVLNKFTISSGIFLFFDVIFNLIPFNETFISFLLQILNISTTFIFISLVHQTEPLNFRHLHHYLFQFHRDNQLILLAAKVLDFQTKS